jgi:hypothetical protein
MRFLRDASTAPFDPDIPYGELVPSCKKEVLVPGESRTVEVQFATITFSKGTVSETSEIGICVDASACAVELRSRAASLLKPAEAQLKMEATRLRTDDMDNLRIVFISPDGCREDLHFTIIAEENWVTILFCMLHLGRYVLDS